MVRGAVESANPDQPQRADAEQVHLTVSTIELDILIDALRSVGNTELAERFEIILRQRQNDGPGPSSRRQ